MKWKHLLFRHFRIGFQFSFHASALDEREKISEKIPMEQLLHPLKAYNSDANHKPINKIDFFRTIYCMKFGSILLLCTCNIVWVDEIDEEKQVLYNLSFPTATKNIITHTYLLKGTEGVGRHMHEIEKEIAVRAIHFQREKN